jgi:hypothetical protein
MTDRKKHTPSLVTFIWDIPVRMSDHKITFIQCLSRKTNVKIILQANSFGSGFVLFIVDSSTKKHTKVQRKTIYNSFSYRVFTYIETYKN